MALRARYLERWGWAGEGGPSNGTCRGLCCVLVLVVCSAVHPYSWCGPLGLVRCVVGVVVFITPLTPHAGPFRLGKSFMLNYFVQYLQGKVDLEVRPTIAPRMCVCVCVVVVVCVCV